MMNCDDSVVAAFNTYMPPGALVRFGGYVPPRDDVIALAHRIVRVHERRLLSLPEREMLMNAVDVLYVRLRLDQSIDSVAARVRQGRGSFLPP